MSSDAYLSQVTFEEIRKLYYAAPFRPFEIILTNGRHVRVDHLPSDARVLAIDVIGNAFMHNMVRIVVGTLLEVARGRLAPGAIERALASKARADLGITAPAHGLYLEAIEHTLALGEGWPYHAAP